MTYLANPRAAQAIDKDEFDSLVARHLMAPSRLGYAAAVNTAVRAGTAVYQLHSAAVHNIPTVEILRSADDPREILGYCKYAILAPDSGTAGLSLPNLSGGTCPAPTGATAMSATDDIAARHFGHQTIDALARRGISLRGIQALPNPDGSFINSETGYLVEQNGIGRCWTYAQTLSAARSGSAPVTAAARSHAVEVHGYATRAASCKRDEEAHHLCAYAARLYSDAGDEVMASLMDLASENLKRPAPEAS